MAKSTGDQLDIGSAGAMPRAGGMRRQVASGLVWTMVGTWGRQAIDLLVFVVLARILVPADFGVVALATVFVLFAQLIVDQGMGDALVQRRAISGSAVDTAFWVALATGALLTAALFLLSGPIAAVLGEPELQPILQALSVTFALSAFSTIQIALLRRDLAFRSLSLRALIAATGGGVVGVVLAATGFGAWALVGQQIGVAVFSVVALWWVTTWRPRLRGSWREFRELFGFGIHVVAGDVLTYLTRNVDNLLIGAVIGPVALGFYVVGYRILSATQAVLVQVTRKMTFPVFSRLQEDRSRMRRAYLRLTRTAAAVILPGYIALSLLAGEVVVVLFGERWASSGTVAGILLLIGPVVALQAMSVALLNAVGRPDVAFRFRLLATVTAVAGFVVAVNFGIAAVAAAYVVAGYLLLPLNLRWVSRYAGIPIGEYLRQMRGVALATVVMAAVVAGLEYLISPYVQPVAVVATLLPIAALTFLGSLWMLDRRIIHDVLELGRQLRPGRRSEGEAAS